MVCLNFWSKGEWARMRF